MSRFLLLLSALSLACFGAAGRQLQFSVETSRLRVTDAQALVEYYVTVDGRTVRYARTPAGFEARVTMTFTVVDSAGGIRFAKKLLLRSPAAPDTMGVLPPFRLHERVAVVNGSYTLRWDGMDQVMGKGAPEIRLEQALQVGFPAKKGVQLADIQLLDAYAKATQPDVFDKGGYTLQGRTTDFYPREVEDMKFYTEIYHAATAVGAGKPLLVRYRLRLLGDREPLVLGEKLMKQPAGEVNPVLATLNLAAVPSGNCELLVEALGADGKLLGSQVRAFQRSNPGMPVPTGQDDVAANAVSAKASDLEGTFVTVLDSTKLPHYLMSLRPVSTTAEAGFIQTLAREGTVQQQRAYLYHFWKKQAGEEAATRWAEYRKRIDFADATYANATFRAYETDCGRVYLQYGPPDQVFTDRTDPQRNVGNSDVRPYQIWNYYKLKNLTTPTNQTNRTFVFFQRNLGDPSPRLIHSNVIGETADPNWRSQIGDRFSSNPRFDRNAGSGGQ